MSAAPAISILTPVWNGMPYIKECIESVLSQQFQNWELLVGDNGSTDGTRHYLAAQTDPRIHIFQHEVNRGISGNLNFLFSKAKAPVAYILCADDYFHPNALRHVMDEWDSSASTVAFICFSPHAGQSKLRQYAYKVLPKNIGPSQARLAFFLFGNFTDNVSNVSVRVASINSEGGFVDHLKTAQDFEMWRRLARNNDLVLSDAKVVFVRQHVGSATHYMTQKGEDYGQLITIYEGLLDQLSAEYDRRKLVAFFNTQISPQYFRTAIKYAMSGNFAFMQAVLKAKSSILWNIWRQVIICIPFAVSERLREYYGIKLAQNFLEQNKGTTTGY